MSFVRGIDKRRDGSDFNDEKLMDWYRIDEIVSLKYPQTVGEDFNTTVNYNSHEASEYAKMRINDTREGFGIKEEAYEPFMFFEFLEVMPENMHKALKARNKKTFKKAEEKSDEIIDTVGEGSQVFLEYQIGEFEEITESNEFIEALSTDTSIFDKAKRVYNGSIALYMPTDIAINDTVVYNEETRKAAATLRALKNNFNDNWINPTYLTDQTLTALVVAGVVGASKFIGRGKKDIPVKVYKGFMGTLQKFFAGSGSTMLAGLGGLAIGSILSPETQRHIGKVSNPHEYMAYQSTGMRNFTFTWKFLPDNPDESVQCREIIKHFRIAAHAERLDTLRLSVPDHVVTSFHGAGDMIQLPPTVIESTTVSYNPNAASFFKHNGAPVEVDLSVTLKEMVPIYKDDVRSGY